MYYPLCITDLLSMMYYWCIIHDVLLMYYPWYITDVLSIIYYWCITDLSIMYYWCITDVLSMFRNKFFPNIISLTIQFQRAILQSGVAIMPWAVLSMEEAKRRSTELAFDYLECPRINVSMDDVSDCLRLMSPDQIVLKQWVSRGPLQFPFLPVIDGVFLPDSPTQLMKRRAFKKCPIIIGSNMNEGRPIYL